MSRFVKNPIPIPPGVEVTVGDDREVVSQGPAGVVKRLLDNRRLKIEKDGEKLWVRMQKESDKETRALAGTYWSVLSAMVKGAETGFEVALELVGVGYRAQIKGSDVVLQLGFSHPVSHRLPEGVAVKSSSQTEIILSGADKILVGQTAAKIRAYRPPEPYKGKGVRYRGESVLIKETKKK